MLFQLGTPHPNATREDLDELARRLEARAWVSLKAYLDSSIVLRIISGEPGSLREWTRITVAIASEIAPVECLRALDRLRLAGLDDRALARRRATMLELFGGCDLVRINRAVLDRASEPFPTQVRTLDAIHVASALLARARIPSLHFATHDRDLATAALALGFRVIGAP
jgi:predicted nucleic acid-binding protein